MNSKNVSLLTTEAYRIKFENLPNFEKKWIKDVENYILTNADQSHFIVGNIAQHLGISERQLYRRVKKILGITPNNFIREVKMEKARWYLEQGEFSTVAEVSFAVGYNRSDYFSTVYLSIHGKRPVDYFKSFVFMDNN